MLTRGLPLEGLWLRNRNRDLASDVAFMNKMVDEIVAERRKTPSRRGQKDMLGAMMTGVDRATASSSMTSHPLPDQHLPDRRHETTSGLLSCTLYALLSIPRFSGKPMRKSTGARPDIDAKPTISR